MDPLVSVIVPVYKVEPYLRKCVDSIIGQTYRNLEIILVDDGSPDNCGCICDEYAEKDSRVKVIHKENGGQASARNAGLDIISGEYVTFVDSDDWLDKKLYEHVMKKREFDIAVFGCTLMSEQCEVLSLQRACIECKSFDPQENPDDSGELLVNSLFGYACNKIINSKILQTIRFEAVPLREDLLFYLEIFKGTKHVVLSEATGYYYRQRENSTTHNAYSGEIFNLKSAISCAERLILDISILVDAKTANGIVKTYLTDYIIQYIVRNRAINRKKKVELLGKLFSSSCLRKNFKLYQEECLMFSFFTVCYILRAPSVFFQGMRGIWENE